MKETNVSELERAGRPAVAGPGGVDVTTTFGSPRNGGEHCEPECSGDPKVVAKINSPPPDPEVFEKATRRRFSAKYKLRILAEIDACTKKGQTVLRCTPWGVELHLKWQSPDENKGAPKRARV